MKKPMKIFLRIFALVTFTLLLFSNWYFANELMREKRDDSVELKKFSRNFYGDDSALLDYSKVDFPLTQDGKDIITNARKLHIVPTLISTENFDKYVCSGYLWVLSEKLWDEGSPYYIGMMEQNEKKPASAWQLPYSYEYKGGKILADFSKKFSLQTKDFWQVVNLGDVKDFFLLAFSEQALLGDIGFFYTDTDYIADLEEYDNYNSHIVKNMGVSDFTYTINNGDIGLSSLEIVEKTLGCNKLIFPKLLSVLENYSLKLNGEPIVLMGQDFYHIIDGSLGEKVVFHYLDTLTLTDVTLAHFFAGAQVDGLFTMTCRGEFFPINILQIHPRFIEKI